MNEIDAKKQSFGMSGQNSQKKDEEKTDDY